MRLLWTFLKVAIALALALPIAIIVLATVLGVFGALLGLAILFLRVAVVLALCWGAFKVVSWFLRAMASRTPTPQPEIRPLPKVDPHYEAAMRELDRELGHASR
jgi:hypothetical protein